MTVLVVDNHRERLKQFVDNFSFPPDTEVIPFYDPMLAVKYSFNNHIDVVFTDINMKRMDGFLLLDRIRQNNHAAQIFFVADTYEYEREAKERGCSDYLVRPVTSVIITKLLAQIQK